MEKHFKILSLIVHKGCNPMLLKALKEDVEYPLYQNCSIVPDALYDIPNGPKVSISAIVGKNGDGKSSIIEMMIRVINNFAFLSGYRENQSFLKFIPGVKATIKYIVEGTRCSLACLGNEVILSIEGEETINFVRKNSTSNSLPKEKLALVKPFLFYMLISNYSLNSFNSRDFAGETGNKNGDWLTPLFHKNDAYQTPVNINPMRTEGLININQEQELAKQRLLSIFTEANEATTGDIPYDIPAGEGFIFRLSGKSKLEEKTFEEYFEEHRTEMYSEKRIAYNKDKHIAFWMRYATLILSKKTFINSAYALIRRKKDITDFTSYLNILGKDISSCDKKELIQVVDLLKHYIGMSIHDFQRIFLVLWLEKKWNESGLITAPMNLNSVLVNKNNLKINAQKYIIYKTVSVFEKYPIFFDGCVSKIEKPINFFAMPDDDNSLDNRMNSAFRKLEEDICNDKTFMTLKIRQCINYLNNFSVYNKWNKRKSDINYIVPGKEYTHFITFPALLHTIRKITTGPVIDYLPPPIFEGEIILRSKDIKYPASQISSGERQMLNMVGAVVYHLRNLASSLDKGKSFRYHNIHIFLDEIELCFHPAYQKNLINYLLGQISAAHLPTDMKISITVLTHSPFVLSDIPQCNILYIKKGYPVNETITVNPFAANVNDILQQSFFMGDGFTGSYAQSKISRLIKYLNDENIEEKDEWQKEQIQQFIENIGEPLLRFELNRLYWNWIERTGGMTLDEKRNKIELLANELGGKVQW